MSRLSKISSKPTLRTFAQGAAQSAAQPVAEFLAPTVEVATSVGQYKVYTEKNRFRIPNTKRALTGRATELAFDADDALYNCQPHALDYPVDNLEQLEDSAVENRLKEGAIAVAEVSQLSHEKEVVDTALMTIGAGTDLDVTTDGLDLVDYVDRRVISVAKAAKYGSIMGVRILFGANAARIVKNHESVRARFPGSDKVAPTIEQFGSLLLGNPQTRLTFMVYDDAPEGLAEDIKFILDNSLIIFACSPNPTRRDPSFMKTFRLMGQWMTPGSYVRDDGRVEVAKFDWSCQPKVTNSAAALRLNLTGDAES